MKQFPINVIKCQISYGTNLQLTSILKFNMAACHTAPARVRVCVCLFVCMQSKSIRQVSSRYENVYVIGIIHRDMASMRYITTVLR